MRRNYFFALSASLLLTASLVLVLGDEPVGAHPGTPELVSVIADPSTTSTIDLEVDDQELGAIVLSSFEQRLTEEAGDRSTTTTSSTTTTLAPRSTDTTEPPKTPTTTTSTTTSTTAPPSTGGFSSSCESDFRSRINSLRSSNGLTTLSSNGALNGRARDWSQRMADAGSLSHSNISGLIPPWSAAGENVGMGGSVGSIFSGLSGSGGHLQNMLGDWTHLGVGCFVDGSGLFWTTHVFAR